MRAVGVDELVDPVGVEVADLRDEAGAPIAARTSSSSGSVPRTVMAACRIEARMIGPESISVPSRSKRTTESACVDRSQRPGSSRWQRAAAES